MKVAALDVEFSGEVPDAVCGDCQDAGLAGKSVASLAMGTWHLAHKTSPAKVLIPKVRTRHDEQRAHTPALLYDTQVVHRPGSEASSGSPCAFSSSNVQ